MRPTRRALLLAPLAAPPVASPAAAQPAWPAAPIRFVIAFPPGGPSDILGRMVAQKITEQQGWTVVVENRSGASGLVGMGEVARAAPDGQTVLINASAHSILPATHVGRVAYDIATAFIPVTLLGRTPILVTAAPALPVRGIADLIAYARANPGKLNYAAGSQGGGPHMVAELFKLTAGIDMQYVSYRGSGPALQDLVAGNLQLSFDSVASAAALVRAGQIRALAVTAPARIPAWPDIPAVAETLPGFSGDTWVAAFLPARTPDAVVARLHAAIAQALQAPDLRARIEASGTIPGGEPQADFARVLAEEMAVWARVVREANIRVD